MELLQLKAKLLKTNLVIDNEFLFKYCSLMIANLSTPYNSKATQHHHIIPRLYYRENNLVLDNSKDNIVNLKYKDHMLAHFYLMKCAANTNFKYKMAYSVQFVTTAKNISLIEQELLTKLDFYQECYEMMQNGKSTYKHSATIRSKLSEARTGKLFVSKNGITKCCTADELNNYLADGWIHGRNGKFIASNKGKICIIYNGHNKYINKDELDYYLKLGAVCGGIKQHIINKGNRGYKSPELREKLSKIRTGKIAIHHKITGKTKYINKEDFNIYANDYDIGAGSHAPTVLHRIWINNNKNELLITIEELARYEKLGYKRGRLKGGD